MLDLVSPTAMAVNYTKAQTQQPPPPGPSHHLRAPSTFTMIPGQHSSLVKGYNRLINWSNNQLVLNWSAEFQYSISIKGATTENRCASVEVWCSHSFICGTLRSFQSLAGPLWHGEQLKLSSSPDKKEELKLKPIREKTRTVSSSTRCDRDFQLFYLRSTRTDYK